MCFVVKAGGKKIQPQGLCKTGGCHVKNDCLSGQILSFT